MMITSLVHRYINNRKQIIIATALMMISACTTHRIQTVPALPPVDVEHIHDPVPKSEPASKLGNPAFYDALGKRYFVLPSAVGYQERGVASWYGPGFHEGSTSSGERYDMYGMTAAHKTLPLPTYVQVTNLSNGRNIIVRVNDRGPFKSGRIIDLSYAAASKLDMLRDGTAFVEVTALASADNITAAMPAAPVASASSASPVTSISSATPIASTMYVQAGAFSDEANAQRLSAQLRGRGYAGVFIRNDAVGGRPLYRVRIGPVASVDEFDRVVASLKSLGIDDAHLALN